MTNETRPRVLTAVTADLLARSRLEDAAARAGWRVEVVNQANLTERLEAVPPDLLVLDLDAGRTELLDRLDALRAAGLLPRRVVGFLSHVDTDLSESARAAGCEVMPRGKFWRSLGALLAEGAEG